MDMSRLSDEDLRAIRDGQFTRLSPQGQAALSSQAASKRQGKAADGGVSDGVKMGLRDPVDAGAQMLRRIIPEPIARAVDAAGNWMADQGLPVARSQGVAGVDRIVNDVNEQYAADREAAGREGFDFARLTGNVVNPVNAALPSAAGARTVGQIARVGATAGAAGAVMQPVVGDTENFWTEKGKQAAGGAAAGAVLAPVLARGGEAGGRAVVRMLDRAPKPGPAVVGGAPALNRADLDAAVSRLLQSQGVRAQDAPKIILDSVRNQISSAFQTGGRLDPAAALRKAQSEALGLTDDAALTAGQLTRDPIRYAQERNLSGVVINTPQGPGNPLATRFQNQNQRLMGVFDDAGANQAADRVTGGQQLLDVLQEANVRADAEKRAAYAAFEQATGRAMPIPLQGLAQDYAETLRRSGDNIPAAVRSAFESLGLLSGKQQRELTIEGAEDLIKNVININDPGPVNAPVHRALGALRAAVNKAVEDGADAMQTGAGAEAAMLGREARATAAGIFQSRRDIPALAAAAKDVPPDRFVQQFLLNAPVREVEGMAAILRQNPAAMQQARAQIAEHLKRAAFGENLTGDKLVAPERLAATLRAIGSERLKVFFSPDELVKLNLAAKIAADINTVPAGAKNAVNYSNTAAGVFNLLQRLAEAPGVRQIPGARALANQAGEIVNERAIGSALQPAQTVTQPAAELSPEARRALQRLFAPAAVAGGAVVGSGQ
jgi:hypothetical protein